MRTIEYKGNFIVVKESSGIIAFISPKATTSFSSTSTGDLILIPEIPVPQFRAPLDELSGDFFETTEELLSSLADNLFVPGIQGAQGPIGLEGPRGPAGVAWQKAVLAEAFPTVAQVNTTRVDVPSWDIPVISGKTYIIQIVGSLQTAALTTGGSIGFVLPVGAGTIHGTVWMDIAQTNVATGLKQSIWAIASSGILPGSFATSTGVGVINSPHSIVANLVFNCTTSGNLVVQWGTEVAASLARLVEGSTLMWSEI